LIIGGTKMIEKTFICNGCGMRREVSEGMNYYLTYALLPEDLKELGVEEYYYGEGVGQNRWVGNEGYCHRCCKKIVDFKKSLKGINET
jgi:hypothetical protein